MHLPDALAAEQRLHGLRRVCGVTITQPIASGLDARRHKREAIAELGPQSLAQRVDDGLVGGVEDERDRIELERLDLVLVELGELWYERKQMA